jgi:ATP-binding cassette, subfamily B, bacterial PglK
MFSNLKSIYKLLTPSQRREFALLQVLVIFMGFAEVAGVLSLSPFMALIGDIDQIYEDNILGQFYTYSGLNDPIEFLALAGVIVFFVLTFAAIVNIFTVWRFSMYAAQVGADLSNRLFIHYMAKPWLFHANGNSSELVNKIVVECSRLSTLIINPFMQLNARLVMALMMCIAIAIYRPYIALFGVATFSLSYYFLYLLARKTLHNNGKIISEEQAVRFKMMSEGFGGIKDTLLLGRQEEFNKRFIKASNITAYATGNSNTLALFPKYLLELLAYSAVIFLVLFLIVQNDGNLESTLPVIAVFALAGFKLLPAFQLCYSSLGVIKGNMNSFESLKEDLMQSYKFADLDLTAQKKARDAWMPNSSIEIENIHFSYPNTGTNTLNNINLTIPMGGFIGVVGSSGSGKSTLIDVILGLIEPEQGNIKIDGTNLTSENIRSWQDSIGVVSQNIFLADSTIRENVAFGLPADEINEGFILNAIKLANLDEFISTLPQGLGTRVGERGVQLSGGQRQRIGIARALYQNASILVFDEATSSLDGITEKKVMDAIYNLSGLKTIIIVAHRLASVKKCSCIYLMHHGEIIDCGPFDDLAERNEIFKNMTTLA